jgi:hypothetical protein
MWSSARQHPQNASTHKTPLAWPCSPPPKQQRPSQRGVQGACIPPCVHSGGACSGAAAGMSCPRSPRWVRPRRDCWSAGSRPPGAGAAGEAVQAPGPPPAGGRASMWACLPLRHSWRGRRGRKGAGAGPEGRKGGASVVTCYGVTRSSAAWASTWATCLPSLLCRHGCARSWRLPGSCSTGSAASC